MFPTTVMSGAAHKLVWGMPWPKTGKQVQLIRHAQLGLLYVNVSY